MAWCAVTSYCRPVLSAEAAVDDDEDSSQSQRWATTTTAHQQRPPQPQPALLYRTTITTRRRVVAALAASGQRYKRRGAESGGVWWPSPQKSIRPHYTRDFSVVEKVSYPPGQSQGPIPGPNPCVGPTRTQIRTRIQTLTSDSEKNTVVLVIQNSPWLAGLHLPRRKCKVRLRRKAWTLVVTFSV